MGMIIKTFGKFKIGEERGVIELNFGDSVHLHVGKIKIAMSTKEFQTFSSILEKAQINLNKNKQGNSDE